MGILNYRKMVGNVIFTDTQKTVTIDFTDAEEYARKVWEKQSERGFLHEYRYLCCSYGRETRIIFLDCRRQQDTGDGGYGLGLSIAAATVASHRGKIIAETVDEKSLRITVVFPL